jgi:hypothetical protein
MRKVFNKTALVMFAFASITATSCLKDEGYENGEYGSLNGRTEGQEFVSIPASSRVGNILPIGVEAKATVQPVKVFALSYDAADPVSSDFTATLKVDNALATAAAPTATILPTNAYTIQSLTVNFAAGKRFSDSLVINMNTNLLDPSKTYALGLTLESVSKAGVQIPSNLKNVVLLFSIKNKYDGVYSFRGQLMHPADRDATWQRCAFNYPYDIQLITTGPNTVNFYNTAYANGDNHPLLSGPTAVSGFGSTRVQLTFDANDKITAVSNAFPNPANGRAFNINNGDAGTGNYSFTDPCTGQPKTVTINNRYDAANKKVYAAFFMTQPGFQPIPIFDTLTFIKARP